MDRRIAIFLPRFFLRSALSDCIADWIALGIESMIDRVGTSWEIGIRKHGKPGSKQRIQRRRLYDGAVRRCVAELRVVTSMGLFIRRENGTPCRAARRQWKRDVNEFDDIGWNVGSLSMIHRRGGVLRLLRERLRDPSRPLRPRPAPSRSSLSLPPSPAITSAVQVWEPRGANERDRQKRSTDQGHSRNVVESFDIEATIGGDRRRLRIRFFPSGF